MNGQDLQITFFCL